MRCCVRWKVRKRRTFSLHRVVAKQTSNGVLDTAGGCLHVTPSLRVTTILLRTSVLKIYRTHLIVIERQDGDACISSIAIFQCMQLCAIRHLTALVQEPKIQESALRAYLRRLASHFEFVVIIWLCVKLKKMCEWWEANCVARRSWQSYGPGASCMAAATDKTYSLCAPSS